MEVKRIQVGDTFLIGYRAENVDEQLRALSATASFANSPDEIRRLTDVIVAELGRASGGDYFDGYFTYPDNVGRNTEQGILDKGFLNFSKNVKTLSDWAISTRGKYWNEIQQAVEEGESPLQAVMTAIRKSRTN